MGQEQTDIRLRKRQTTSMGTLWIKDTFQRFSMVTDHSVESAAYIEYRKTFGQRSPPGGRRGSLSKPYLLCTWLYFKQNVPYVVLKPFINLLDLQLPRLRLNDWETIKISSAIPSLELLYIITVLTRLRKTKTTSSAPE